MDSLTRSIAIGRRRRTVCIGLIGSDNGRRAIGLGLDNFKDLGCTSGRRVATGCGSTYGRTNGPGCITPRSRRLTVGNRAIAIGANGCDIGIVEVTCNSGSNSTLCGLPTSLPRRRDKCLPPTTEITIPYTVNTIVLTTILAKIYAGVTHGGGTGWWGHGTG